MIITITIPDKIVKMYDDAVMKGTESPYALESAAKRGVMKELRIITHTPVPYDQISVKRSDRS